VKHVSKTWAWAYQANIGLVTRQQNNIKSSIQATD